MTGLLAGYDTDDSGRIEADERDAAVEDWQAAELSTGNVQDVIAAYEDNEAVPTSTGSDSPPPADYTGGGTADTSGSDTQGGGSADGWLLVAVAVAIGAAVYVGVGR